MKVLIECSYEEFLKINTCLDLNKVYCQARIITLGDNESTIESIRSNTILDSISREEWISTKELYSKIKKVYPFSYKTFERDLKYLVSNDLLIKLKKPSSKGLKCFWRQK